jgi:chromosome partitioning protein
MIITIGNTKGGVGKTTTALNIAIARALAGRDVWLIDGDRQGTAQIALTIRDEAGKKPSIACAQYSDGATLRNQVKQSKDKYDDIVIDVGGRDSTALRAALTVCDVLLIPFSPRSLDVWALSDVCALIDEAMAVREEFPAYAFLNGADPAGTDNAEAIEALADYPQLEYLDTPIRRRKSIATAAGQGMSVLEATPKDPKAIAEIQALIESIYK